MKDKTIEYYNMNADSFYETTVHADMSEQLDHFVELLPVGCDVLDAGCGSGRDSLALIQKGFRVEAFDASEEMCKKASTLIGKEVKLRRFEDLDISEKYDGIWACASLLHVAEKDMADVMKRLAAALTKNGVLYASYKKGVGEHRRGGRKFTDANEAYLREVMEPYFHIIEIRESRDVRPERDEIWMNVFAKKKCVGK